MFVHRPVRLLGTMAVAFFFASFAQTAQAQGSMQGPNNPTTVVSTPGPFSKPWINPGNASASDNVDTTATVTAPLQQSDFLDATGYGFSIAGDRVIRRIEVTVEGRSSTFISTARVQLLKGGVPVGSPMTGFIPNTPGDGNIVLNDQDDVPFAIPLTLWGTTWTPAEINAANFGVRVDFQTLSGSPSTYELDNVRVTVHSFPMLPTAQTWGLIAMVVAVTAFGLIALLRRRHRAASA